jgi:mRNA-degrading endonuclease toxin of MazEF toxin-antitoxin module
MSKDLFVKKFDEWSTLKKKIEADFKPRFSNTREVWWCSFGVNIGTELCGKNELHERPILILKVYNATTVKVLPLTSKPADSKYTVPVKTSSEISSGILSQVRTISSKRLTRKIERIHKVQFDEIITAYKASL